MTDDDLALYGALDNLGIWPTQEPGPDETRDELTEEFRELVGGALDALRERNGRDVVGPDDFEALVAEAEGRDDLIAHTCALDGAAMLLARFEGEMKHKAGGEAHLN